MSIQISVAYDSPSTDAFDAMLAKYAEVKQLSTDTIAHYAPLADVAEEAKFAAIRDQLNTIIQYLWKLQHIGVDNPRVWVGCPFNYDGRRFYAELKNGVPRIRWECEEFTMEHFKSRRRVFNAELSEAYNILGNWDKWNVYARLEKECIAMLEREIQKHKEAAEKQTARLANITGV